MQKEDIKIKLYKILSGFGINPKYWAKYISVLQRQLEFLHDTKRHRDLLKNLLSSNDRNNFNSFAFEASFAYDFESKGRKLIYEVKTLDKNNTKIDFIYPVNNKIKMYFELRVINPVAPTKKPDDYDKGVKIRVQNLILSKCQDKKGNPIKFKIEAGSYNFIVAYVSELHMTMFDTIDCYITMYGNNNPKYGNKMFGLCQDLPAKPVDAIKKYCEKVEHFRKTIHGVLFVKNVAIRDPRYFVNPELEYFPIDNNNLLDKKNFKILSHYLGSFLRHWAK